MEPTTCPLDGQPVLSCRENRILSGGNDKPSLLYETSEREFLRWMATFPLPEIGETIQPKFQRIGPVEVTGYFRDHGQIGVIVLAKDPPRWLSEESKRERAASLSALHSDSLMANKLCLLGNEIEPPTTETHESENALSSRLRTAQAAL